VFGQMANTLNKDPTAANTMANAPVSKTNVAKPGNPNASPETPAAGTTYDPAKSAADKQAKNQADQQLATQQMKATADANAAKSKEDDEIKAAAAAARAKPGFQQTAADKLALKTAANKGIKEAQDTASPLDAYRNRTDGRYQQALKAFVQQNLLAGMPYARLQNAQEIDRLIKTMSQPQNATPQAQTPLWQQLALATAVAAVVPQSAGGAGPEPTGGQSPDDTAQSQSAQELIEPVRQAMQQSQIDLAKPGQVLRSKFNNNETAIRSTGNVNVDAMLLAMGFTI
jgi:murein L,D-transpeptidase YcbB/YkuD